MNDLIPIYETTKIETRITNNTRPGILTRTERSEPDRTEHYEIWLVFGYQEQTDRNMFKKCSVSASVRFGSWNLIG